MGVNINNESRPLWDMKFAGPAAKAWRKLDRQRQRELGAALARLREVEDPRDRCKPLGHALKGLWRLRVGDYRIILDIRSDEVVVVVLDVGTRADVYISPNTQG